MDQSFKNLREAAKQCAQGAGDDEEMWLALLIRDAEAGHLACIKAGSKGEACSQVAFPTCVNLRSGG